MRISIDESICKKYNMTLPEVLGMLLVKTGESQTVFQQMLEKQMIVTDGIFKQLMVTQRWDDVMSNILLDSDSDKQSDDRLDILATALMEIFPKQKKVGTSHYFRGNRKDVILRLKKFFKLYGDKFSDEQILDAAKRYVESFNGNYQYMRVLKYFLWKDEKKVNTEGEIYIDESSDLATLIENVDSEDYRQDWTTSIS